MLVNLRSILGTTPLKLIAVIFLAILGPSVVVTALGLVAVFQAQAFVRDRFTEPLRTKVEEVRRRLTADWGGRLAVYADVFRDAADRRGHLRAAVAGDPWIRDLFLITPAGIELLPEPPARELFATGLEPEIQEVQRLEAATEQGPTVALAECRRLLAAGGEEAVQVELLLAAARLSHAVNSPQESRRYLWEVYRRFGDTRDASGVLRGLPVLLRIADLEREAGPPEAGVAALQELQRLLLRRRAELDTETEAYYADKLAAAGIRPGVVAEARLLQPPHLPPLEATLGSLARAPPAQARAKRLANVAGPGELDLLLLRTAVPEVGVGLVLDRVALLDEARIVAQAIDLPAAGFELVSPHAAASLAGASIARGRWPEPLDTLELRYVPPPGSLPEGFRGFDVIGLATFTWAVIVLVLTILVGAVFTIRSVLREMRTARLKSDFVSFITHELKTPLTSIRMLAETILDGKTENPDDTRDCLALISNETERLSKLIEQVLEFSRIEHRQKQFRFAACDMEEVVQEAVRLFRDLNRLKPREVEIHSAQNISRIKMDRAAMVELLLNLLTNAAKYSPADRKITVNLRESIDDICVDVVDRGIGIRKRDQKRIFQGFFRADDYLTREVEGTGLGLTFARYIARVHNGDIKVSSQPNSGSVFTLQLRKTEVMAG